LLGAGLMAHISRLQIYLGCVATEPREARCPASAL
jgi:hypothetical protein